MSTEASRAAASLASGVPPGWPAYGAAAAPPAAPPAFVPPAAAAWSPYAPAGMPPAGMAYMPVMGAPPWMPVPPYAAYGQPVPPQPTAEAPVPPLKPFPPSTPPRKTKGPVAGGGSSARSTGRRKKRKKKGASGSGGSAAGGSSSHRDKSSISILCVECEERSAEWACEECDDCFCSSCWAATHRRGRRASHTKIPARAGYLSRADRAAAQIQRLARGWATRSRTLPLLAARRALKASLAADLVSALVNDAVSDGIIEMYIALIQEAPDEEEEEAATAEERAMYAVWQSVRDAVVHDECERAVNAAMAEIVDDYLARPRLSAEEALLQSVWDVLLTDVLAEELPRAVDAGLQSVVDDYFLAKEVDAALSHALLPPLLAEIAAEAAMEVAHDAVAEQLLAALLREEIEESVEEIVRARELRLVSKAEQQLAAAFASATERVLEKAMLAHLVDLLVSRSTAMELGGQLDRLLSEMMLRALLNDAAAARAEEDALARNAVLSAAHSQLFLRVGSAALLSQLAAAMEEEERAVHMREARTAARKMALSRSPAGEGGMTAVAMSLRRGSVLHSMALAWREKAARRAKERAGRRSSSRSVAVVVE